MRKANLTLVVGSVVAGARRASWCRIGKLIVPAGVDWSADLECSIVVKRLKLPD